MLRWARSEEARHWPYECLSDCDDSSANRHHRVAVRDVAASDPFADPSTEVGIVAACDEPVGEAIGRAALLHWEVSDLSARGIAYFTSDLTTRAEPLMSGSRSQHSPVRRSRPTGAGWVHRPCGVVRPGPCSSWSHALSSLWRPDWCGAVCRRSFDQLFDQHQDRVPGGMPAPTPR
jgi:hypothetical protein